jgi:hypothetical protein
MPKNAIVYTQEAISGNAELGVKISCASSLLTGCVIVFEIFRRNGDCTFYVAVTIGGAIQKKCWGWRPFHLTRPLPGRRCQSKKNPQNL